MSDTTKTLGNAIAELADNIEAYNHWRRGADIPKPNPEALGVWLSAAVDVLRIQAAQAQAEPVALYMTADERYEEIERLQSLVIDQGNCLSRIVNIIRGEPAEGCAHSTHDVVDLVQGLKQNSDRRELVTAIIHRLERACGTGTMPPTLIAREFLGSAHERQEASAVLRRWHAIVQAMLDAAPQPAQVTHLMRENGKPSGVFFANQQPPAQTQPERKRLSREQIEALMTEHYPLESLLRENVDVFESCVRDIELAIIGQQAQAEPEGAFTDEFRGTDAQLVQCIGALLSLDAKGALYPHGIGGHARTLLSSAAARISAQAQADPVAGTRCKLVESCKSCQHSVERQSCGLAGRDFDSKDRQPTPPDWCPLPLYTAAPQPAQPERIPLTDSQREALVVNMMLHGKMDKHTARQILALVLDGVQPADFEAKGGAA